MEKCNDQVIHGNYFMGNEVSDEGKRCKRVDYETLAKSFDHVYCSSFDDILSSQDYNYEILNGDIEGEIEKLRDEIDFLQYELEEVRESGDENEINEVEDKIAARKDEISELDDAADVCQYFIIDQFGAELLQRWTDETVYYVRGFDMYVWGVRHYGTSWDYVMTDIEIE